jgi:hypothetical protein
VPGNITQNLTSIPPNWQAIGQDRRYILIRRAHGLANIRLSYRARLTTTWETLDGEE